MDIVTFGLSFGAISSGIVFYKLITYSDVKTIDEKIYKPMNCRKFINKCEKLEENSKKSIF